MQLLKPYKMVLDLFKEKESLYIMYEISGGLISLSVKMEVYIKGDQQWNDFLAGARTQFCLTKLGEQQSIEQTITAIRKQFKFIKKLDLHFIKLGETIIYADANIVTFRTKDQQFVCSLSM